eukprot:6201330-Pleurochrysis_carterae.AAC.1
MQPRCVQRHAHAATATDARGGRASGNRESSPSTRNTATATGRVWRALGYCGAFRGTRTR